MVKIVDYYEDKRRRMEMEDRLYSLAEEMFGKDRCYKGQVGNIHVFDSKVASEFSVTIAPFLGEMVKVSEEKDYETSLRFAEMAEGIIGKELTLRTEYKKG